MNPLMLKLVGLGIVVALATGAWFYVRHLQDEIKIEQANSAVAQEALKSSNKAVDNLVKDFAAMKKGIEELNTQFAAARKDVQALDKKFTETKAGEKRDIENLAAKHPALIEKAINNGSKEAGRCNQLLTGAKPEPGEKNSLCPGLLK